MNDAAAINAETSRQIYEEMGLPPRKPRQPRLYDERCYDLAEYFLPQGTDVQRADLADWIQRAVEDFLTPTDEPGGPATEPQSC